MQEQWGRRLRRLGTGVTTSGAGLPFAGEDEERSAPPPAPHKGRCPGRPLNSPRIEKKTQPEPASPEMEGCGGYGPYTVLLFLLLLLLLF